MDKAHERRFELLGLAVLLTAWGGAGLLTQPRGYTDALYEPDFTIRQAPEGGVLADAGFQAGDTVVAVEGIPVEELGMYSRWPRSLSREPGESLRMTVRRGGRLVEGSVVALERPASVRTGGRVLLLFTQAFLWLGMWLLFTTPTAHAGRMALLGIVAGFATPGPNLGSLNGFRDHLEVAGEVLFLILLLHFLLLFPRAKRPARSPWIGLIYVPWVGLLLLQVAELVTHPRMYHSLGGYLGILFLSYILASGMTVIHTAATLPAEEHAPSGMGPVLVGWAVAFFPNLLVAAGWVVPPGWEVPGARWFPFLLLAIPVGMALGVRRQARGVGAQAGSAA
jgi:hypothetical protein